MTTPQELAKRLRDLYAFPCYPHDIAILQAADMLKANSQELKKLHTLRHEREDVISNLKDEIERLKDAQQVAAPQPPQQVAVPSRFTSVGDGLPEPDATYPKEYLVRFDCGGGEIRHAVAYYLLGDYVDPTRRHWSGHGDSHNSVLAWAPILAAPQPPQEQVK